MSRRSALLFLSALLPAPLAAQDGNAPPIEEIVVSADYRQSGLYEIPASVTVLDEDLMSSRNALHLEDILLNAPNVNLASGASRARFYQIRGIGERGQFVEPLNPSVGLIIDGVDFSGIGNAALLYDVEQVEILLGPQGTRYGSNALAGLINLQSKAPTAAFSYGAQLQAGNYDSRGVAGYLSGPLGSGDLLYRLSGQTLESDGYGSNRFLGRPTNFRDENLLRGKLRWTPGADLTLDVSAALVDIDNGYDAFSLDNVRDTLSDQPGFDRQRSELLSAHLTSTASDYFTLEAIAGFADADIAYGYDEDWVFEGFHPFGYTSTDHYFRDRRTLSGEVRLLSTDAGRLLGLTDWVAGLYTLRQDVDLRRAYTFLPADFTSRYDIDRVAAFAETETALGDDWSLVLGLRAERFEADYRDSEALSFQPGDDLFGGKLALNYRMPDGALLYASLSRGYKTGGFNTDGTLDADLREFDAEELWNYELGFKGLLYDDRLQTRAALFYMDRDEVQISSSIVRVREDGSSEFIDFVGNAAAGSNYGLELGADWIAADDVRLFASLGLLKTEYQDFVNSAGDDLDGREQAHAPNWQYTLGSDWSLGYGLALNLNLQGRDAFYFSDSHNLRSEPYHLLNASLSWTQAQWRVTLWGRNLNDEDYFVRGYHFGNDPRKDYEAEGYTQLGEPRRFGVTINYDL